MFNSASKEILNNVNKLKKPYLSILPDEWMYIILPYLLVSLLLMPVFIFHIGGDANFYHCVAQRYIRGEWYYIFNGYWSPMICWCYAIILSLKLDFLLWSKILNIVIGLLSLIVCSRILTLPALSISKITKNLLLLSISVNFVRYSFDKQTPDLLAVCFLLIYFYLYSNNTFESNPYRVGVIGALLYFTKAYCFYFFLLHYCCIASLGVLSKNKVVSKASFFKTMSVFFFLSGLWIVPLSIKYQEFTITKASGYNFSIIQPDGSTKHTAQLHILPPLDSNSISYFEDVSISDFKYPTSGSISIEYLSSRIKSCIRASGLMIRRLFSNNPFYIIAIIIGMGFLLRQLRSGRAEFLANTHFQYIVFIGLYSGGYILTDIDERYIWIVFTLLTIYGGYLLELSKSYIPYLRSHVQFIVLTVIFCIFNNIYSVYFMMKYRYDGYAEYKYSMILQQRMNTADDKSVAFWQRKDDIELYAYHLSLRIYAYQLDGYESEELMRNDINKYQIKYLFLPDSVQLPILRSYQKFAVFPNYTIYQRK